MEIQPRTTEQQLLANIKDNLEALLNLLHRCSDFPHDNPASTSAGEDGTL